MHWHAVVSGILTAALLAILAVAPEGAQSRPPAAPGAKTELGEFVWHDLVTNDPAAGRAFYGALFGWTFGPGEGVDPGYTIIRHEGRPIGGIVLRQVREGEPANAQWLAYVVVADVDKAAEAFQQAGGRIFRGPLSARKDLRVAAVADAQGAPLGLASRGPRLEEVDPPPLHRWLWMEYLARDPDAALKFYSDALGFRHEIHEARDDFTYYLLTTNRPQAGLFRSPWERETSAWLPYVRVSDPMAMAARAADLGATIVLAPGPQVRNGSLAIVLDPTGAPLALQKYPFDRGVTP